MGWAAPAWVTCRVRSASSMAYQTRPPAVACDLPVIECVAADGCLSQMPLELVLAVVGSAGV